MKRKIGVFVICVNGILIHLQNYHIVGDSKKCKPTGNFNPSAQCILSNYLGNKRHAPQALKILLMNFLREIFLLTVYQMPSYWTTLQKILGEGQVNIAEKSPSSRISPRVRKIRYTHPIRINVVYIL